jgi:GNAT superfamily N-acetyltransferase
LGHDLAGIRQNRRRIVFRIRYIAEMSSRRVTKANHHARVLLQDIADSTRWLYETPQLEEYPPDNFSSLYEHPHALRRDYFIGFEKHIPFGYVGLQVLDEAAEIVGPFLYREYLGQDYGKYLLDYALDVARAREAGIAFTLVPSGADWAANFFSRNGFDPVSAEVEFLRRWHEGVLAARELPGGIVLFASLVDAPSRK